MRKIFICCVLALLFLAACSSVDKKFENTAAPSPASPTSTTEYATMSAEEKESTPLAEGYINETDLESARKAAKEYLEDLRIRSGDILSYSELRMNPEDPTRSGYGGNISLENIIVFRVDLELKEAWSGFDEGKYSEWSIIITRADKNSDWEYRTAGY